MNGESSGDIGGQAEPAADIKPPTPSGAIERGWFWSIGEDARSLGDFLICRDGLFGRCLIISRLSVPISRVESPPPLIAVRLL